MTQANTARRDGDDFQARQFWLRAGRLLDSGSPILRVGFESGPRSYDDIWVEYETGRGPRMLDGRPLEREHIQCKWHVSPGSYGYRELVDPAFINADARSLLQRARGAQMTHAPAGEPVRFTLLTNWRSDRADPLQAIMGTRSGAIRVERLFDTKTDKSKTGAVRKHWREHLAIDNEDCDGSPGRWPSVQPPIRWTTIAISWTYCSRALACDEFLRTRAPSRTTT